MPRASTARQADSVSLGVACSRWLNQYGCRAAGSAISLRPQEKTSVYLQRLPAHPATVLTGKEGDGVGDVCGPPMTTECCHARDTRLGRGVSTSQPFISVAVMPGDTPLTVMPRAPCVSANERVITLSAPLVIA